MVFSRLIDGNQKRRRRPHLPEGQFCTEEGKSGIFAARLFNTMSNVNKKHVCMRKLALAAIVLFSLSEVCTAGRNPEVERLKAQQEILKLNAQLNKLQIEYEKAVSETEGLKAKAIEANSDANASATTFSTADAAATAKEAKERVKAMERVKETNKKLAKNQKTIATLKKKIQKVQSRLDKLGEKIEFVGQ